MPDLYYLTERFAAGGVKYRQGVRVCPLQFQCVRAVHFTAEQENCLWAGTVLLPLEGSIYGVARAPQVTITSNFASDQ